MNGFLFSPLSGAFIILVGIYYCQKHGSMKALCPVFICEGDVIVSHTSGYRCELSSILYQVMSFLI